MNGRDPTFPARPTGVAPSLSELRIFGGLNPFAANLGCVRHVCRTARDHIKRVHASICLRPHGDACRVHTGGLNIQKDISARAKQTVPEIT